MQANRGVKRRAGRQMRGRRGSTLILVMFMLPVFLIPLVGLAIDGTMLYIVQSKLQSACDGAALGAGRLIGTKANTAEIAGELLNVNFPVGWWGTSNLLPTITATNNLGVHTVDVNAQVDVPLLFMRVLGKSKSMVSADATATRKDTRTVMVLDRSGSMNNVINGTNVFNTMVASAKLFAGMMTPGIDQLGLVVYGGSGIVAYPQYTLPYVTGGSTGGPDINFATTSTTGPIFDQLNLLKAGGGTGMTEGLAMAFLELQKAHYRDLNGPNGVDTALNAIVLFTDGVPDALAVSPNDSANPTLKTGCGCNNMTSGGALGSTTRMRGYLVATGSPPWSMSANTTWGLFDLSAYDSAKTLSYWLGNPGSSVGTGDMIKATPTSAGNGCNGLYYNGQYSNVDSMMTKVPPVDIYGNSTNGNFYNKSSLSYNGTNYQTGQPDIAYHFALASWNATDNLGETIRSQTLPGMLPVTIYTIGFTGNGGTDAELLRRLANTQTSSSYDATQQTGMYIQVDNANDIAGAFSIVAAQVLRLAK